MWIMRMPMTSGYASSSKGGGARTSSAVLTKEMEVCLQGRPIDFLTPAPVVQYISERKLYVPQSNRPDTLL